jgi:membrane peptidoglycan carboxypeptidase
MGQEIGVTPIQLAAAFGAIANDGMYNPPYLIEAFVGPDGARHEPDRDADFQPRRTVSAKTARTLRDMLQEVTIDGTGTKASVVGYTTGGKTGTAQKIDPVSHRYVRGHYAAWFGGFVPAAHPALVIIVMVDEPRGAHQHGGDVSAPVFSRVAEPVLRYLGVLPDREEPVVIDRPLLAINENAPEPLVRPASLRTSTLPVSRADVLPLPFSIKRAAPPAAPAADGTVVMPDLTGLSLRDATAALASVGLNCSNQRGGQRVARQEPVAGIAVRPGARCSVIYE